MMGEEKVHCDLNLGQFGIVALTGGMIKSKNFDVIRLGVGKHINESKGSFAIYRVDPPYKAITNHGFGKRMGGGKGSIEGYGTPVRAGRIILEVGGKGLWDEPEVQGGGGQASADEQESHHLRMAREEQYHELSAIFVRIRSKMVWQICL